MAGYLPVHPFTPTRLSIVAAGVLGLASFLGCGTGAYNDLTKQRLVSMRTEALFQGLYGPSTIAGTPFSIRIPMHFRRSFDAKSGHPDDGAVVKPERLQPPFLTIPGLKVTYEGRAPGSDGFKLPFYCYVAAVPGGPEQVQALAADLQKKLKAKFPGTPDAWESVAAETPDGKNVAWTKLRLVGIEQPFFVKDGPKLNAQKMTGNFELWMHEGQGQIVLIGWRVPSAIDVTTDPSAALPSFVNYVPDDAKPDLQRISVVTAGTIGPAVPDPVATPAATPAATPVATP